jgi:predicted nucleic acid-binding protein
MNVIVDTSVWSLALRRRARAAHPTVTELADLIGDGRVAIIGPIRQELLSGIRHRADFDRLRDRLREFPDTALLPEDFERAAAHFNACRARGLQGSNTDFLICSVAERTAYPVLTTDNDFRVLAKVLPIRLYCALPAR